MDPKVYRKLTEGEITALLGENITTYTILSPEPIINEVLKREGIESYPLTKDEFTIDDTHRMVLGETIILVIDGTTNNDIIVGKATIKKGTDVTIRKEGDNPATGEIGPDIGQIFSSTTEGGRRRTIKRRRAHKKSKKSRKARKSAKYN
jgi:hypothetical protein